MESKLTSALEILRERGPGPVARETGLFLTKQTSIGRRLLYKLSTNQIRKRMEAEEDLDDIFDTVLEVEPGYPPYEVTAMQLRDEIEELTALLADEEPQRVLEIGTAKGGTFYIWSRYLESIKQIVSLDLPGGEFGGGYDEKKTDLFQQFAPSKRMDFVRADSHRSGTFDTVSDLVSGEVDFLFLDGDHTYEGVKQDFEMYSQLVSDGGIIALHDIATHPDKEATVQQRRETVDDIEERHLDWAETHQYCNVDGFWEEIVDEYETEEIVSHPEQTWGGIGIVYL